MFIDPASTLKVAQEEGTISIGTTHEDNFIDLFPTPKIECAAKLATSKGHLLLFLQP